MKGFFKVSALLLSIVMLISFTACTKDAENNADVTNEQSSLWDLAYYTEDTELGDGTNTITAKVTADGKTVTFTKT